MGVGKLGVHEQLKVIVESEFFITKTNISSLTLLDNGSAVNWLDHCVN